MSNYPEPESFLQDLEHNAAVIINEVIALEKQNEQYANTMELTKYYNKKNTIGKVNGWNQIRFLCQDMPFLELMEKYNLTSTSENPSPEEFQQFKAEYNRLYNEVFPQTSQIIKDFYKTHRGKFTNIAIYKLQPDTVIPVHTNYDPHIYRCHMGLVVPEGDIGMMVEGEKRAWEVGKFFAFDSMRPHTVWNKTKHARYVLSVDCYRTTDRYDDVVSVHKALVELRMKESKLSLGLSGGRSQLNPKIRKMYASEHEVHDV